MNQLSKRILRFLPAFIWMSFIFYLSSRSTTGIGRSRVERFLILKTFHLIEYAVLYILICFATKKPLISVMSSFLYAITDEIHQTFVPGREGMPRDAFIDLLGISIGSVLLGFFLRIPLVKKIFSL